MKNVNLLFNTLYTLPLANIAKIGALCLGIIFISFTKNEPQTLSTPSEYTSIAMIDGVYQIDSSIAMSNWKKEKMIEKIASENLIEKKTIEVIPEFIKDFLASTSINKTFDVANPSEEWQEGGWINGLDNQKKNIINATSSLAKQVATKQLIYFGLGKNMAIVSYYIGGMRKTQHVIIIKFNKKIINDVWFDNAGSNYSWTNQYSINFTGSKDEMIKYLKSLKSGNC